MAIEALTALYPDIQNWWSFWKRKVAHWANLFRPTGAPRTNLSEPRHSAWYSAGGKSQNLVDGVLFSLADDAIVMKQIADLGGGAKPEVTSFFFFVCN